jgi:hypothetical protein
MEKQEAEPGRLQRGADSLSRCYEYRIYNLPNTPGTGQQKQAEERHGCHVLENALNPNSYNAILICSPYATIEAFKWLADGHKKKNHRDETALYFLTSKRNRKTNPNIVDAAKYWRKEVGGLFFLKVYTETSEWEDVMHAKLYLFVKRDGSPKDFGPNLPTERIDQTISGYFGSCNFTPEGLGIGSAQQNCEMLAEACDDPAKKRLRIAFRYFWKFGSGGPLHVMKYDPNGKTGCFVY